MDLQGLTIRTVTEQDLGAVERLLERVELPREGLGDQWGAGFAVAVEDGDIVGAAGIERYGRFGLLRSVVTDPRRRGRGIAEAMVRNRLAWAGTEGLDGVYLLTTTAGDYFPRLGFERVARDEVPVEIRESKEFATVCPGSAVAMRIGIGDAGAG